MAISPAAYEAELRRLRAELRAELKRYESGTRAHTNRRDATEDDRINGEIAGIEQHKSTPPGFAPRFTK
jgi:hypothetical protein